MPSETLTGYDFFQNLPEPIQRCVEAGLTASISRWIPTMRNSGYGDNCPFPPRSNPGQANLDGDSMGDACDPDDRQ